MCWQKCSGIRRSYLDDLFNDLGRSINFFDKYIETCPGNLNAVSVLQKLKALVLKLSRALLLLLLAKALNLRMIVTVLHGLVCFHACTRVAAGKFS